MNGASDWCGVVYLIDRFDMKVSKFYAKLGIKKIKMAECVGDFESCLSKFLLKLNETGSLFAFSTFLLSLHFSHIPNAKNSAFIWFVQ